jgi:peptidoglycan/LPS O-acetylase OafA/YrhL
MAKPESDRLYSLDALRGIAALSVVFWHWQHFYMGTSTPFIFEAQPLFSWFSPLYRNGDLAVDFFFLLSGFIFFWLYPSKIFKGEVSARDFFILRYSRLYPLHFLTLVIIALQQFCYWKITSTSFVYPKNDIFHFILNLFFVSSIKLEKGYSFNAPTWSVSVEVFVYFLFFLFCKIIKPNTMILASLSLVGYLWIFPFYGPIGRGVGGFFLGGSLYLIYRSILKSQHQKAIFTTINLASSLLWGIGILLAFNYLHFSILDNIPGVDARPRIIASMTLFSATILSAVLFENQTNGFFKKVSALGDISYSSYLLHFPLQLFFAIFVAMNGLNVNIFNSPLMLISFFVILIVLSIASYQYLEMPLQKYIRKLWFRSKPKLS